MLRYFKVKKGEIMKKKHILILTICLIFVTEVKSGCLENLDNDLLSTKKQLEKYNCRIGDKKIDTKSCLLPAPNGWEKYYIKKLKKIKAKAMKCLS